jgi:hypothetical protein
MNAQGSRNSQSVNEALFVRPAYRRAISLALVVVAGVFVSVTISYLAYHWEAYDELEHQRSQFQLDAQEVVGSILQQIATHVQALRSLGALFEASKQGDAGGVPSLREHTHGGRSNDTGAGMDSPDHAFAAKHF